MSFTKTENAVHNTALTVAEGVRQAALAAATTMAAARTADIVFHRAGLTSALANGIQPHPWMNALRELGTGGT